MPACAWTAEQCYFAYGALYNAQSLLHSHSHTTQGPHTLSNVLFTPPKNHMAWYDRADAPRPILMAFWPLMRLAHHAANATASKLSLPCTNTPSFHFSRPLINAL